MPTSVATTIWPPLTGKSHVVLAVAGATPLTVIPACLMDAETLGLTSTSVFSPTTVAGGEVLVVVADVLELGLAVAAPLVALLVLELLPHAAAPRVAAAIKAMMDSDRKLRA